MAGRTYTINKLGLEDLIFGTGTQVQLRNGVELVVTEINAKNLPFDEANTLQEVLDNNYPSIDAVTITTPGGKVVNPAIIAVADQNTYLEIIGTDLNDADSTIKLVAQNMTYVQEIGTVAALEKITIVANDIDSVTDVASDLALGANSLIGTSLSNAQAAATSASQAAASASSASTSATNASTSATNASNSASAASTSASNASNSASAASTSASNAATSESNAEGYAQDAYNATAGKADLSYVNGKYSGFKNLIINGGFDVWQRGETSTLDNNYGCVDRFFKYSQGDTTIWGKGTDSEKGNYCYFTTDINGYGNIRQILEPVYIGGNYTFSCWVKSDHIMDLRYEIWNLTDNTLISGNSSYQSLPANEWTKIVITFDMSNHLGSIFHIMIGRNTGGVVTNIKTAQWQLEKGSVATPFEVRPYGLELSLCQRYYWKFPENGDNILGQSIKIANTYTEGCIVPYPVTMRTVGTVTVSYNGTNNKVNYRDYSISGIYTAVAVARSKNHMTVSLNGTAPSNSYPGRIIGTITVDAEL